MLKTTSGLSTAKNLNRFFPWLWSHSKCSLKRYLQWKKLKPQIRFLTPCPLSELKYNYFQVYDETLLWTRFYRKNEKTSNHPFYFFVLEIQSYSLGKNPGKTADSILYKKHKPINRHHSTNKNLVFSNLQKNHCQAPQNFPNRMNKHINFNLHEHRILSNSLPLNEYKNNYPKGTQLYTIDLSIIKFYFFFILPMLLQIFSN